ncbi:ABC transporter ATP-binding protein [Bradyrhizobium sp.]|uniref:ABC transporter ATP-binding protein n=1 Tax=Bradyrhizobium sp. TaxID=376 RepID=UPI00261745EF|nr:ABC transporter ATP-binding protein [Bradyrhizobium sp.]
MPVIDVNGVWKTYHNHARLGIKERLVGRRVSAERGRFARNWALQDVSFTIEAGRSLGVVGHNGTGKSTLLSLILGTIEQDRGEIRRKGNIGGMLALGAGCHPDLTGRENIYLNGSILGLRLAEIRQKFDSIVDFSELESAIDLPLRTYSSGMSARLAFSVLAHAHRDVMLIDEVLAVGDASFQAKCATYFADYQAQGGTLIVVSHDLISLQELCAEGIWLHEGKVVHQGPIAATIECYRKFIVETIGA